MDVTSRCNTSFSSVFCLSDEEASASLAVTVIPSLLASSTVVVVLLIFCSLHRNRQRRARTSGPLTGWSMDLGKDSVSAPKMHAVLSCWEIPAECALDGLDLWQKGHYGPICKGRLKRKDGSSQAVVVKSLRDSPNKPEAQEFLELVAFHSRVCRHENVVRMLFCQTSALPMFLVLDQSCPGNLLHFLWTLRNNNLTPSDPSQDFSERSVFLVAKQVAAGLDYLMSEHRLVHGDVAARNILIGPGLSARVSGLGGAYRAWKAESALTRAAQVPLKWQAPESIMMQLNIDRSDVWSFGILLYEMITLGSPPYPELEPVSVLPKLQRSYRMKRPDNCGSSLYDLMKYCWMWSFKDRPALSIIIKLLDSSLYQASRHPICVPSTIDILQYNTTAGIST